MRVLQIVPSISLIYGGPSQMVRGLSQALAAAGATVEIVTTNANGDRDQPPLDVPLQQPIPQPGGYTIRYFRCAPFRRYKFSLNLLRWLSQNVHHYDIVHIHALFSPLSTAAATLCRWRKVPYILRPLGTLDPLDLRKKQRLKAFYGQWLERPNLAGAAAVHFTSEEEARISERFGVTTHDIVIPLGVQLPEADSAVAIALGSPVVNPSSDQTGVDAPPSNAPPLDAPPLDAPASSNAPASETRPSDPIVLFMSRIDPKKGFDLLIPALDQLVAEGVGFRFVVAGSNPQDPEYEAQTLATLRNRSWGDRVDILGFVSGATKRAWLDRADVFVLPSYYENFGIAVAEAMAAGVPVAISKGIHIWPAVVESGGGWVCDCTVEGVTDMLRTALSDRADCRQRGDRAQRYAHEYYSWPAIADQTLTTYAALLQR
jgi:glycosyltransferase involved in cell wall biosynthesis